MGGWVGWVGWVGGGGRGSGGGDGSGRGRGEADAGSRQAFSALVPSFIDSFMHQEPMRRTCAVALHRDYGQVASKVARVEPRNGQAVAVAAAREYGQRRTCAREGCDTQGHAGSTGSRNAQHTWLRTCAPTQGICEQPGAAAAAARLHGRCWCQRRRCGPPRLARTTLTHIPGDPQAPLTLPAPTARRCLPWLGSCSGQQG